MRFLLELAAARGLNVELSRHMGEHLLGVYEDEKKLITLNAWATWPQKRWSFAHELGHAWYQHQWTGTPHDDEEAERRADEHGALLLIDPAEYARAEALHGSHPGALACELEVTPEAILTWQRLVTQRGRIPRIGFTRRPGRHLDPREHLA